MIVAGIGSRRGVSAAEVVAAVDAALKEHGLERGQLAALATTEFKRGEKGIFEAGGMMGLEVVVVDAPARDEVSQSDASAREIPPPLTPPLKGEGNHGGAVSMKPSKDVARVTAESPSPLRGGVRGGGMDAGVSVAPLASPLLRAARDTSPPEGGEERSSSGERSAPPLACLPASSPRARGEESQARTPSLKVAGVESVSEAAALAAAGEGARLAGPRIAVGRVTCAIAFGEDA